MMGPWKAHEVEHGIAPPMGRAITITTDDRRVVVYVGTSAWGLDTGEVDLEEYARLIAAAPDLLEALRFAASELPQESGACAQARAAIAKAEGDR